MNRAQSAITYSVQRLEAAIGCALFDRSAYRPDLTEAGRALVPHARQVLESSAAFGMQARALSQGIEGEMRLVVDAMFPMTCLFEPLTAFGAAFPTVRTRLHVETMGATVEAVLNGFADIGFVIAFASRSEELASRRSVSIELVPVASAGHPLATLQGGRPEPIADDELSQHLQLVLTDRTDRTRGKDHGVVSLRNWRLSDLGAKHAMLLAGMGWGNMPLHIVASDLEAGRLVRLRTTRWSDGDRPTIATEIVHRRTDALGRASSWFLNRMSEGDHSRDRKSGTAATT